jgi:hypothetical protein
LLFVSNQIDRNHVPVHKNAIVTMLIGETYINTWVNVCQDSWVKYAIRHGFDIIVINNQLDDSDLAHSRSPAWQKLLILEQSWSSQYDQIVWLDSDIIINGTAPNILDSVRDRSRFGIAENDSMHPTSSHHILTERLHKTNIPPELWPSVNKNINMDIFKKSINIDIGDDIRMYNTGVFVISPAHHRGIMIKSYRDYNSQGALYEQPALSYEICKSGLICEISNRFNWFVFSMRMKYFPDSWFNGINKERYLEALPMLRKELSIAYFLHFAVCMPYLHFMEKDDLLEYP